MNGIDYVKSMCKMLQSSLVVHARLLHVYPVLVRGLTNQQAKKLVTCSLSLSQDS